MGEARHCLDFCVGSPQAGAGVALACLMWPRHSLEICVWGFEADV